MATGSVERKLEFMSAAGGGTMTFTLENSKRVTLFTFGGDADYQGQISISSSSNGNKYSNRWGATNITISYSGTTVTLTNTGSYYSYVYLMRMN